MNNQDSTDIIAELDDIELGYMLDELQRSKAFQKVIIEGYINDTLLNKSVDLCDSDPKIRAEAQELMRSVSHLKRHFTYIKNSADSARIEYRGEIDEY